MMAEHQMKQQSELSNWRRYVDTYWRLFALKWNSKIWVLSKLLKYTWIMNILFYVWSEQYPNGIYVNNI